MVVAMASLDDRIGCPVGHRGGDALGAPYSSEPPAAELRYSMVGRGPGRQGEWTDDTAMAIAIGEGAIARGGDARDKSFRTPSSHAGSDGATTAKTLAFRRDRYSWAAAGDLGGRAPRRTG